MRLFRILGKSISNAFKSIVRNFSLSLASISCTAITLILVSIALLATYNVNSMTKNIEGTMTIVAFIDENATDEEIENVIRNCYTGNDFVVECSGHEDLAKELFEFVDWQHPNIQDVLDTYDEGEFEEKYGFSMEELV